MSTARTPQPDTPAAAPASPSPAPASPGIEVQGVSKSYRRGQRVLSDVNLHIRAGESFGIIGPNGAAVKELIEKYKAFGFPNLVVVSPDGRNVRRKSGYDGYTDTMQFLRLPTPSSR
jgi:ABC-2 type transport system ATP-binding protein